MRAARDPPSELEDGPLIIIEGPAGLNLGFWEGIGGTLQPWAASSFQFYGLGQVDGWG